MDGETQYLSSKTRNQLFATGLQIEKIDHETKEVAVTAPSGKPDFDTVREKIDKAVRFIHASYWKNC